MSVDSTCTIIVLAGSNLYELMVTISDEGCGITSSVVKSVECTMSDLANEYHSVKTHAMYGAVVMDNTKSHLNLLPIQCLHQQAEMEARL